QSLPDRGRPSHNRVGAQDESGVLAWTWQILPAARSPWTRKDARHSITEDDGAALAASSVPVILANPRFWREFLVTMTYLSSASHDSCPPTERFKDARRSLRAPHDGIHD